MGSIVYLDIITIKTEQSTRPFGWAMRGLGVLLATTGAVMLSALAEMSLNNDLTQHLC